MGDDIEKNDDDKDVELDLMAEQEYVRLTRQYRVMDGDKEAYIEEANKALNRQRKIIADLEHDKKNLYRLITISKSNINSRKEAETVGKIVRLTEEQDAFSSAIDQEKMIIRDLEREIYRIERQIGFQRYEFNGEKKNVSICSHGKKNVEKRIVLLENRLDSAMVGFNATLSRNTFIRKEIDHLVQERSHFNEVIAKMQKKISSNKRSITDITELAIQAFDQRDESQSKVKALQERNEKDSAQYTGELKELQRTLDHDQKLKDFLFQKSNERIFTVNQQEHEKETKRTDEKDLERNQKYKNAFEKIRRVVGSESNLDKIVGDFIKIEDQNFALFNYVTEMNNQVEGLQENISRLKNDIRDAKGRGDDREKKQKEQLLMLEDKLSKSKHEAENTEVKLNLMESVINKLKSGTEQLYCISKCGLTPVISLLDNQSHCLRKRNVSENNIIMHLDIIYEKIFDLICIENYLSLISRKNSGLQDRISIKKSHGLKNMTPFISESIKTKAIRNSLPSKDQEDGKNIHSLNITNIECKPFDMPALKLKALAISQKDKKEATLSELQLM